MYQLGRQQIVSWRRQRSSGDSIFHPGVISLMCPACGTQVSFTFSSWHKTPHGCSIARMPCPACHEQARFLLIGQDTSRQELSEEATLWVHPAPRVRKPLPDLSADEAFPEALLRTYESALNVYNANEWMATAVISQRLLEGIANCLFPGEGGQQSLAEKIGRISEVQDLSRPIRDLAEMLQGDGNLAACFSLEREPDQEAATVMLELIEQLIEYLFVIPRRIRRLQRSVASLHLPVLVEAGVPEAEGAPATGTPETIEGPGVILQSRHPLDKGIDRLVDGNR